MRSNIMMQKANRDLKSWGMMILLSVIWGSSFILIKKGLQGFSAYQLGSLRIVISMIALSPFLFKYLRQVKRSDLKYVLGVAIVGSGIPPFLFAIAETHIDSAMAGIINSSTPLFTFLLGILFFGTLFRFLRFTGVIIGMTGSIALLAYGFHNPDPDTYLYGLLVVVATICYATSVNLVKHYLQNTPSMAITAVAFLMVGIPASIYLFSTDFIFRLHSNPHSLPSLGYIAILAVIGTAFANVIFFYMTQRTTALFASTVTYFIPVIAVLWGLADGEQIGWIHFLGMAMILLGVYLASRNK